MNKLIEFAKEQCEIFPEDSEMGMYLRETLKILQAVKRKAAKEVVENIIEEYIPIIIGQYGKIPLKLPMAIKAIPPVTPKCRCSENPNKSEIPTGSNDLSSELEKTRKNSKKLENRGYRKGHSRGYKEGSNIVLSKIKAEIAEMQLIGYATVNGKREIASRAVMQVIDKYKAESEE